MTTPADMLAAIDAQILARVNGSIVRASDENRSLEYLSLAELKDLRAHYAALDVNSRIVVGGSLQFAPCTNVEPGA